MERDEPIDREPLRLDPRTLKGLAHPLRLRLLGALREFGPATATELGKRLGESSGATSYHLRQLAGFGMVEEASRPPSGERASGEERPSRRERWWRACHSSTYYDAESLGPRNDETETALLGAEFLRAVAMAHAERSAAWIAGLPDSAGPWRFAGGLSDWALSLDPEELRSLERELGDVIERYPRYDPEAPREAGRSMVAVQLQLLPRPPRPGEEAPC